MQTDFGYRKRKIMKSKQQTSCDILANHQMQTFEFNNLEIISRIREKSIDSRIQGQKSKSKQLAQNKHYQQQNMIQQGRANVKSQQNDEKRQRCQLQKTPNTAYNHRRVFRSNDRSNNNMLSRQSKSVSKDDSIDGKYRQLSVNGINLLIIKFVSLPKEKSREMGLYLFERLKQATIHLKANYSYLQNIFVNYNLGVCYLNYESTGFASNRIFFHFNLTLQGIHEECSKGVKNNIKELVLFSWRTPKFVDIIQKNSFLHSLQASILLQLGSFCSTKIRDNGEGYKYSQKSLWKSLISIYEQQALYLCWFLRFMVVNNYKVKTGRQNIPYSQTLAKLESRRGQEIRFQYEQMKVFADYFYILMVDIEILIKSVNTLINSPKTLSFLSYFTKSNFRIHRKLIQCQNFVKELWASILNYTLYDVPNFNENKNLQLIKTFIHNQSKWFEGDMKTYKFQDLVRIRLRPYQQFSFPKANKSQNMNKACLKNIHTTFLHAISSLYAMSVQSKLASKVKIQNESLQKVGIELSISLLKICYKYSQNYFKHTSFYYQVKVQHDCLVLPHQQIKQYSIEDDEVDSQQPNFQGQYQMIELSDEENLESEALYDEVLLPKKNEGSRLNDEKIQESTRRQNRYKFEQEVEKKSRYEQRVIKSLNISLQKLEEEQSSTRREHKIRSLEKKVLKDPAVKKIIAVYNESHKRLVNQKKQIRKKDNEKQSGKRVNMYMVGPSYFSGRKFHFNQAIHEISSGTKKYKLGQTEHLEHSSNISNTQIINYKNIRLNQKQMRFNRMKNFEKV